MKLLFVLSFWILSISCYEPLSKEIFCKNIDCSQNNHIFCNGVIPKTSNFIGTSPTKINLTMEQKQLILDTHNELRNIIATGKPQLVNIAGELFPKASNMHKLIWSDELEWQADLNAATCSANHDCPSTENYMSASQNLGYRSNSKPINETQYIKDTILNWFYEFIYTPLEAIDSYSSKTVKNTDKFTEIEAERVKNLTGSSFFFNLNSHFTTVVKAKTSKIGCSFYSCGQVRDLPYSWYFVCNYEFMNMFGEATYKYNVPENCARSKKYCGLCLEGTSSEENEEELSCLESDLDFQSFKKSSAKLNCVSMYLILIVVLFRFLN